MLPIGSEGLQTTGESGKSRGICRKAESIQDENMINTLDCRLDKTDGMLSVIIDTLRAVGSIFSLGNDEKTHGRMPTVMQRTGGGSLGAALSKFLPRG